MKWLAVPLLLLAGCLPPGPNPGPGPNPFPPGPSPPIDKDAWLIVIEESADRTPETAEVIRALPTLGYRFRVYDDDSPDAEQYVKAVRSVKKPALLILPKSGKSTAMALPQNVAALKRILEGVKR